MKQFLLVPQYRRIFYIIMPLLAGGLILLYLATGKDITYILDEEQFSRRVHAQTVASAIRRAGIELREGDEVFPPIEDEVTDGEVIEIRRGYSLIIELPEERMQVSTTERSPANILASAGIPILPADQIWVDGLPNDEPSTQLDFQPERLRVRKAFPITISTKGQTEVIWSSASTLGEAILTAGFQLYEGDHLDPPTETPLQGPLTVQWERSSPVVIEVDGEEISTRVVAETVGDALAQAGFSLQGLDYAVPDEHQPLPEEAAIQVVRVKEEVVIEQEPVPYETIYQAAPDLEIDHQTVLEPGSVGVKAKRIRVRFENGQEIKRFEQGEWIARKPSPRKIGYGTKIVVRSMATPDGTIEYWRAIRMYATSYSPSRAGVSPDNPDFGITACGEKLVKGIVAIDRRYIPFYTQMYVPGYGFAYACDTGGGVKGRWIDLGYEDDNYQPWHQYVTVYFRTPVPSPDSIAWIIP